MSEDRLQTTALEGAQVHVRIRDDNGSWLYLTLRAADADILAAQLQSRAAEARRNDHFRAAFKVESRPFPTPQAERAGT